MRKSKQLSAIVYPQEDPMIWALRYELEIYTNNCRKCNKQLKTTQPYAYQRWRGLISKTHDCGPAYNIATSVQLSKDGHNEWKEIFKKLWVNERQ